MSYYKPSFADQLDIDYICHHGIKGQKWGVKRYQNADGSYTSKGKARRTSSVAKGVKTESKHLGDKWNSMDPKIKKKIIEGATTLAVVGAISAYGHSKGGKGVLGSYMTGINEISQNNPISKAVGKRVEEISSKHYGDYDLDNMGPTFYRNSDGKQVSEDELRERGLI